MSEILETKDDNVNNISLNDDSDETEHDLQFSPVVNLPEVEVSLNEDEEIEMLKIRAKLFRFDSHSDPPEWKERGTGELKLLKHKENNAIRIVMRRDKTYKICANHFLNPWVKLIEKGDRAFLYTVQADFADETIKSETLAVKFVNSENANIFKNKFEEAQKILVKDCHLYNGEIDHHLVIGSDGEESEDDLTENKENEENNENSEITQKLAELEVSKKEDEKLK